MSDINSQKFEHSALEADIEKLNKEIESKRNLPEYKEKTDKELIKQSIRPLIYPQNGQKSSMSDQAVVQQAIFPKYFQDLPAETKLQIERLIDLTFHSGVEKTINRAKRASPFILDVFHDILVDKLYDELKKRKII